MADKYAVTSANLIIREQPVITSNKLGTVPAWEQVGFIDGTLSNGYVRLVNRPGWIAFQYLVVSSSIETVYIQSAEYLRVRGGPGTAYTTLEQLPKGTLLAVMINTTRNGFIKLLNRPGWVAVRYLSGGMPTTPPPPVPVPSTPPATNRRIWGINIDPYNPTANPPAAQLKGVSYARLMFKVASAPVPQGRTLDGAFNFYDGIIRSLATQGTRVILIIAQESITDKIPWNNNGHTWGDYTPGFAEFLRRVAQHYRSDVFAYEVWNEQDQASETSVYIPPSDYGRLLRASVVAVNGLAKVITGGLVGGDPVGYMKACGSLAGVDGLSVHPYGQVVSPIPGLVNLGNMSVYLGRVHAAFPFLPLWLTEYGIARVDVSNRSLWPRIAQYMKETFVLLKSRSYVAAAVWFAWSDSQDNAGIVQNNQTPKGEIYTQFVANTALDK